MSTRKSLAALLVVLGAGAALAESPNLGRPISEADIQAWDITILPNGAGLPAGQGTPAEGAKIYAERCAACHGDGGRGGPGGRALVGGAPLTDNETYALTAYLLSLNKLIGDNDVMDAKTLPQVKMPNRDNFTLPYPDRI